MARITRVLMAVLRRSARLLPEDRADWIEGLVAESTETRGDRAMVAWLLGGLWLIARELLTRGALRRLVFIATAAVVLWIAWPGSSSDSAVLVNRIEIPIYLVLLALAPPLVRHYLGPVGDGWLQLAVRIGGYLVLLTLITAKAVEAREGQKLGQYFAGGKLSGLMVLVLAGYIAAILILTSQRVRLTRSGLAIAIGTGTLTGVALYALYGYHLNTPPPGWWAFAALALPLLTGFAVTHLAARDAPAESMTAAQRVVVVAVCATATGAVLLLPPPAAVVFGAFLGLLVVTGFAAGHATAQDRPAAGMTPAEQGGLVAVCATGTAVLLLAALTTLTIALAPNKVPLQTPPPPANGGCETCDPATLVIPPGLRREYWVGLSISQDSLPCDIALIFAPMFAMFAGGIGVGLGEASLSTRKRLDSPGPVPPPATAQTQA